MSEQQRTATIIQFPTDRARQPRRKAIGTAPYQGEVFILGIEYFDSEGKAQLERLGVIFVGGKGIGEGHFFDDIEERLLGFGFDNQVAMVIMELIKIVVFECRFQGAVLSEAAQGMGFVISPTLPAEGDDPRRIAADFFDWMLQGEQ